MKVWVVYGYNETEKVWDELDFHSNFRKLRYFLNPRSRRLRTAKEHGFTKFVFVRRSKEALWCYNCLLKQGLKPYNEYFTSARVDVLLRRLAKYERASLHTSR